MHTRRNTSISVLAAFAAFALLFAVATFSAGCASTGTADPTKRLIVATEAVNFSLATIVNARDAGLITQAEVNTAKPYIDAVLAAKATAKKQLADTNTPAYQQAIADVEAALVQLQPLLNKIATAKKASP